MRQYTRFLGTLIVCFVMLLFFAADTAAKSNTDPIARGLWQGSNFNLTARSPQHHKKSASSASPSGQQNSGSMNSHPSDTAHPVSTRYAALGDSVAAGLGLPLIANADARDRQCGRSKDAYPELIASRQNSTLTFAACSGATAGDLATRQAVDDQPDITAQLDTAFANGRPDIITITAGANDIHWADAIRACYSTTCDTAVGTVAVDTLLAAYRAKIYYALSSIYARSGSTPPKVYMTGYYALGSQGCLNSISGGAITPSEISWFSAQTTKLNAAIETAASHFSFVTYVPLDFTGHGLCASDRQRWVQGLGDTAPFHPTVQGQQAIARVINARF